MSRLLGLRNIVCSKEDWHYLVFYDIDREIHEGDKHVINYIMCSFKLSYILYKTKNGYHLVGLSPVNALTWAHVFSRLKTHFGSYYSGNVIRLSRKKDEEQKLITIQKNFEVIPNLYNLYANRFNYEKMPWIKETSKYLLVFEKYRSVKE